MVFSKPLLLKAPLESEEKAPPASVLDLCIRTNIINITDSITFAAKMRDCIHNIIAHLKNNAN
jgi:hypothetical protein